MDIIIKSQDSDKTASRLKNSGMGIASFTIGLIIIASFFITLGVIAASREDIDSELAEKVVVAVILVDWILSFVGLGLGIAGAHQQQRKNLFAIIGVIVNIFFLVGLMLLIALSASMAK